MCSVSFSFVKTIIIFSFDSHKLHNRWICFIHFIVNDIWPVHLDTSTVSGVRLVSLTEHIFHNNEIIKKELLAFVAHITTCHNWFKVHLMSLLHVTSLLDWHGFMNLTLLFIKPWDFNNYNNFPFVVGGPCQGKQTVY